jgi:hypothetical protein
MRGLLAAWQLFDKSNAADQGVPLAFGRPVRGLRARRQL